MAYLKNQIKAVEKQAEQVLKGFQQTKEMYQKQNELDKELRELIITHPETGKEPEMVEKIREMTERSKEAWETFVVKAKEVDEKNNLLQRAGEELKNLTIDAEAEMVAR